MDIVENQGGDNAEIVSLPIDECCDFCCKEHTTSDCPQLQAAEKIEDASVPSRAELTLPANLKFTKGSDGKCKIVAKIGIAKGVQFGPFEAPLVPNLKVPSTFPLKVFTTNGKTFYLDATDKNSCNWMCLVATAESHANHNLIAYQLQKSIFYCTTKDLQPDDELVVGYSVPYGRKIAKSVEEESKELSSKLEKRKRGRPRKIRTNTDIPVPKLDETVTQDEKAVDHLNSSVEVSLVRNLSPRDLGVKEGRKEWQCSKCSAIYQNCYDFAKHLEAHYKPLSQHDRQIRRKGQVGRNMQWRRKRKICAIASEGTSADESTTRDENSTGDRINEHETDNSSVCDTKRTYAKKGCKWKGDTNSHVKTIVDKRFQSVREERSQTASEKYNLRKTRKTLVFSEDEISCSSDSVDDEDGDQTFNSEDDLEECFDKDVPVNASEPNGEIHHKTSMEELLEVAASDILASTICQSPDITSSAMSLLALQSLPRDPSISQKELGGHDSAEMPIADNSAEMPIADNASAETIMENQNSSEKEPENGNVTHDSCGDQGTLRTDRTLENNKDICPYKCDLCGKGFEKSVYLYRHIKKHTGEYICKCCKKVFARKEGVLKHFCVSATDGDDQQDNLIFSCEYCSKSFHTKHLLRRHLVKHVGLYTCSACGKSYSTKEILQNHVCPHKPSSKKFACNVCGKNFSKDIYLQKHVPVHTGQHSCPICSKWLRSAESLTNHMRMCGQVESLKEKGEISCSSCHLVFTDIALFRRHEYEHTHAHACDICGARFRNSVSLGIHVCQGLTYSCNICKKVFSGVANLQRHKLNHKEPTHKCNNCNKSFHRRDLLLQHSCNKQKKVPVNNSVKKQDDELSPFMCEICGSLFSSNSSLIVHKKIHGEKKFICAVCGKRFHRKDLLLEHNAVHGEASFPCPTCSKRFKTKKSLDIHVKLHGGIKRFKCSMCDKSFFQKGNLQKHEDTHSKDQKYRCEICSKSFRTKAYLKIHSYEHTTGRIYSCSTCGNSFVKAHQLVNHMKLFHGNHMYVCKYCGLTLKLQHSLWRHLKKKHADMESDWKQREVLKSMIVLKDYVATDETSASGAELHLVSDFTTTQGAEVLLAVAGYGSEELQEAIASGRAHIKQGAAPNTIEIALPYQCDVISPGGATEQEQIMLKPDKESSQDKCDTIATVADGGIPQESNEKLLFEENSNVMQEERQDDHVDVESSTRMQAHYEISLPVEDEGTSEGDVTNATEYCIYPVTIAHPNEPETIEQEQYAMNGDGQLEESEQQTANVLEGNDELGQQIVIAGDEFQMGTHHIVLNASQLEELQSRLQDQESGGTIVLEDGASNLLLYVMTDKDE